MAALLSTEFQRTPSQWICVSWNFCLRLISYLVEHLLGKRCSYVHSEVLGWGWGGKPFDLSCLRAQNFLKASLGLMGITMRKTSFVIKSFPLAIFLLNSMIKIQIQYFKWSQSIWLKVILLLMRWVGWLFKGPLFVLSLSKSVLLRDTSKGKWSN